MHPVSFYINFVLHAVYGQLAEADALMRMAGDPIWQVAGMLASKYPVTRTVLYRGVMLDPAKPYQHADHVTFMSWSEDSSVARWFACPGSYISEPLARHDRALRGHMIQLVTTKPRILFHHAWARAFDGLAHLALQHPFMGTEGARQIAWSLRTQSEVVTEPVDAAPVEIDDPKPDELRALDERLMPSWITRDDSPARSLVRRGVSQESAL